MTPKSIFRASQGFLARHIPAPALEKFTLPALELLHAQLDQEDWELLDRRWIEINISDIHYRIWITAISQQLVLIPYHQLAGNTLIQADASISGPLQSFQALLDQNIDPESLFFQRKLQVTGDTELGYWFKAVLDRIDRSNIPKFIERLALCGNKLDQWADSIDQALGRFGKHMTEPSPAGPAAGDGDDSTPHKHH